MLLIKVLFIKKHVTLFFSLLKMKKQLCHLSLFLFFVFNFMYIVGKVLPKVGVLEKRGDCHIGVGGGGCL